MDAKIPVALPRWCTVVRAEKTTPGTNTYVLRSDHGNVVVDPGPLDESHLRRVAGHGEVALTLLTHHHSNHAEGAVRFHEMTGAPVLARDPAHCIGTHEPLWEDGESTGVAGLLIDILQTPGHTSDSICFIVDDGSDRAVLTGDTLLGRGSAVVAHPDGALAPYLSSLRRIIGLGAVAMLPGHGPMLANAATLAREHLSNHEQRLDLVRAAVASGAQDSAAIVKHLFADVDPALWPAAELSIRAQLDYLAEYQPPMKRASRARRARW